MTDPKPILIRFPWFTLYGMPERPGTLARVRCAAAMVVHELVEVVAGSALAHSMPAAARYSIGAPPITVPASRRGSLILSPPTCPPGESRSRVIVVYGYGPGNGDFNMDAA